MIKGPVLAGLGEKGLRKRDGQVGPVKIVIKAFSLYLVCCSPEYISLSYLLGFLFPKMDSDTRLDMQVMEARVLLDDCYKQKNKNGTVCPFQFYKHEH